MYPGNTPLANNFYFNYFLCKFYVSIQNIAELSALTKKVQIMAKSTENNVERLLRVTHSNYIHQNPYIDEDPTEMLAIINQWCNGDIKARFAQALTSSLIYNSAPKNKTPVYEVSTFSLTDADVSTSVKLLIVKEQRMEKIVVTALIDPDWCSHWYTGNPLDVTNYEEFTTAFHNWTVAGRKMPDRSVGRPKSAILNNLTEDDVKLKAKWQEVEQARRNRRTADEFHKQVCADLYQEYMSLKNK